MALVLYDRVRETTAVLGTNDAILLGAVTGYQSFAVVGNTNTCYYTIADANGNWEVGLGTYSSVGPTLARTTVYASSNGGSKVSFPAGTKDVFLTYPAEKAVQLDANGNVSPLGTIASGVWQGTAVTTTYGGTGLSSYTAGDLPYYATGTALSKLGIGTNGQVLKSTGTAPSWVDQSTLAVTAISFGTTGLTPATSTQGSVTVAGTLATTNGGTGLSSYTAGDLPYYATGTTLSKLGIGTNGYVLKSTGTAPAWEQMSNLAVTTFSGGTTGLTPSTPTGGAVTLAGTLALTNGGTGATTAAAAVVNLGVRTSATGSEILPSGTTAQRDAVPAAGYMRFNSTLNQFEGYNGTSWGAIGGGASLSNDTSTATALYPLFANATTGSPSTIYTSNANYLYTPSTGELAAKETNATNGIVVNSSTVASNYTVATGSNAMSAGTISINSGVTVTVSAGSTYTVI